MLSIAKQDVFKTIIIIWFVAATGYFVYDVYAGWKIRGMQAAYQQGYSDSVEKLIDQTEKSGCQPFEATKGDKQIQLVDGRCLQQMQAQAQPPVTPPTTKK